MKQKKREENDYQRIKKQDEERGVKWITQREERQEKEV